MSPVLPHSVPPNTSATADSRTWLIVAAAIGTAVVLAAILCFAQTMRTKRRWEFLFVKHKKLLKWLTGRPSCWVTQRLSASVLHSARRDQRADSSASKPAPVRSLCALCHCIFLSFFARSDALFITPLFFGLFQDVEEVEPYASYVQRVNSIYNSSIDLFS